MQLSLLDYSATELRDAGMSLAADTRPAELQRAREIARDIAIRRGTVTADDVQEVLIAEGIELGNAAGSIFKTGFTFTGRYVQSRRPVSHARVIKVWRAK